MNTESKTQEIVNNNNPNDNNNNNNNNNQNVSSYENMTFDEIIDLILKKVMS